jgi:carbon-monoxide dehydrogenase medium subunit
MYEFEYVRPKSVAEAAGFLAANGDARLMSGGMTLLPTMKQRLAQASHLVHVGPLGELKSITREGDTLVVGSAATHDQVQESEVVRSAIPALAKLARGIGDPQVRYMGTIGGSIANNDPAADYPAGVLGLGATVVTHLRQIAADDYFQGLFTTALASDEILVGVRFPACPAGRRHGFAEIARRHGDYAMLGVALSVDVDAAARVSAATVVLFGAADLPIRAHAVEAALIGEPAVPGLAEQVAPLATDGLEPRSDHQASAAYRRELARVLVRRTLAGEASLRDLVAADPVLGPDAAALVAPGVSVRRRTTPGGAGPGPVAEQLERFRRRVGELRAAVADDVR